MALLLDPNTMDWKTGLASSFFQQNRYAEAAALCGQLIEEHPDRTDLWLLQANAYIGMERPLDAAEIYEIVDQLGGSTAASLNKLGDIYVLEELYKLAADSYIRALEDGDASTVNHVLRSTKVLAAKSAYDDTRRLITKIEELHGSTLDDARRKDILKLRARLAVAAGEAEEEVRVLKEIVELDPLDGEALILLGQQSGRTGDVEQAEFYFERAAALESFEADAKVRHAQLLVRNGKYNEALPLLRRAQQIQPRDHIQDFLDKVERVARTR